MHGQDNHLDPLHIDLYTSFQSHATKEILGWPYGGLGQSKEDSENVTFTAFIIT
jgi:hypothetical protein